MGRAFFTSSAQLPRLCRARFIAKTLPHPRDKQGTEEFGQPALIRTDPSGNYESEPDSLVHPIQHCSNVLPTFAAFGTTATTDSPSPPVPLLAVTTSRELPRGWKRFSTMGTCGTASRSKRWQLTLRATHDVRRTTRRVGSVVLLSRITWRRFPSADETSIS